jgi:hypothetical protein
MDASEQAVCDLLMEWKKKPDLLITLEMLKLALKPLVDLQVGQYNFRERGVREIDVREAADRLLVDALESYSETKGSLSGWVQSTLKALDGDVSRLQAKYDSQRAPKAG